MWLKLKDGGLVNMDHVKSISAYPSGLEVHLVDGSHGRLAFYTDSDGDRAKLLRILNGRF